MAGAGAGAGAGGFSPLPTNVMGLNEVKFQLRREKKTRRSKVLTRN